MPTRRRPRRASGPAPLSAVSGAASRLGPRHRAQRRGRAARRAPAGSAADRARRRDPGLGSSRDRNLAHGDKARRLPVDGTDRRQARRARARAARDRSPRRPASSSPSTSSKPHGGLAYVSGHLPMDGAEVLVTGRVGADVDRRARPGGRPPDRALDLRLASARCSATSTGSPAGSRRSASSSCAPGFDKPPAVINGFTELDPRGLGTPGRTPRPLGDRRRPAAVRRRRSRSRRSSRSLGRARRVGLGLPAAAADRAAGSPRPRRARRRDDRRVGPCAARARDREPADDLRPARGRPRRAAAPTSRPSPYASGRAARATTTSRSSASGSRARRPGPTATRSDRSRELRDHIAFYAGRVDAA